MIFRIPRALLCFVVFCLSVMAAPGDIDPSFGIGGRGLIPMGKISFDQGRASALQSDGKIIVIGDTFLSGDGKFDPTVFRPSSATWYSQRSTAGTLIQQFGSTGDQPVPNAFVP